MLAEFQNHHCVKFDNVKAAYKVAQKPHNRYHLVPAAGGPSLQSDNYVVHTVLGRPVQWDTEYISPKV